LRNELNSEFCLDAAFDIQTRRIAVLRKACQTALPTALAITLSAGAALTAPLPSRPVLTLEAARAVVTAAEVKAKTEGWPCVISVVDSEGLPIILERMDDAAVLAGVELAPGKARTAALFRRESGALEDAVNGRRPAAATARGFVLMRGGIPITVDGHIVGAIGVAADTPDHDELIAKAGAAAISQ
jgi:glc operon protein GlcG